MKPFDVPYFSHFPAQRLGIDVLMEVQRTVLLLLLLLLAALLPSASAQTCEPFAGSPTYCDCLTDYDVYVPPGVTQATLASTLLADLPENLVPLIPPDCRNDTLLVRVLFPLEIPRHI